MTSVKVLFIMPNYTCLDTFLEAWFPKEAHASDISLSIYPSFSCNEGITENEG